MTQISHELAVELSKVRPGQHHRDLLFLKGMTAQRSDLVYDDGFSYNVDEHYSCIINFGPDHCVCKISFHKAFPNIISIFGFKIGMPLDQARKLCPELAFTITETLSNGLVIEEYERGKLAGGLEIWLRSHNGDVGGFDILSVTAAEMILARRLANNRRAAERATRVSLPPRWRTLADPDEMLDAWVEELNDRSYADIWRRYVRWIKGATLVERHQAALAFNWDHDIVPLLWIARKSDTDIATACRIFFLASPSYYLGRDHVINQSNGDVDHSELLHEVIERVNQGFYTNSMIKIDGKSLFEEEFKFASVPAEFLIFDRDLPGEMVFDEGFGDGIPMHIWRELRGTD